jgi:hypothetical protein
MVWCAVWCSVILCITYYYMLWIILYVVYCAALNCAIHYTIVCMIHYMHYINTLYYCILYIIDYNVYDMIFMTRYEYFNQMHGFGFLNRLNTISTLQNNSWVNSQYILQHGFHSAVTLYVFWLLPWTQFNHPKSKIITSRIK